MSLDETTERKLIDARARIAAQLDELEFRVTGKGGWRQRGPQDRGDVYDALKSELHEIDQLLETDESSGHDPDDISKFVSPSQLLNWSRSDPTTSTRLWAAFQIGLLVTALGFAVAYSFR